MAIIPLPDDPGRFDIEILESRRIIVTVDPALRDAARAARDPNLLSLVRRADFFLARLQERWTTLRRITAFVADRQRGYLRDGPSAHVPLTRASVAAGLGMHESTVSRATAGKYVRLPTHQTVAFDVFFDGSTGARSALRSILATEPRALSDAELGRRLELAGFAVARRTVTKYRERMGYLPSTRRSPAGPDAHGRRWANPASIPVNRDSART